MIAVLVISGLLIAAGLFLAGVASADRVRAALAREHGEHSARNPSGEFQAAAAEAAPRQETRWTPSALLTSDELQKLDVKVDVALSAPRGEHPYPPRSVRADLPVQRVQTPDRQPWDTASMPAVDEIEAMRQEYVASYLREHGATRETMREAMERLHAHPVPAFGEAPVATVLAAQAEAEAAA